MNAVSARCRRLDSGASRTETSRNWIWAESFYGECGPPAPNTGCRDTGGVRFIPKRPA